MEEPAPREAPGGSAPPAAAPPASAAAPPAAPALAATASGEDPADLELALRLHRELNAPQRREPRSRRGAGGATHSGASSSGSGGRGSASGSGSGSGSDSDSPEAGAGPASPRRGGGAAKRGRGRPRARAPAGRSRLGRPPRRSLAPHEVAAATARKKAGRPAAPPPPGHFKCFVAGLPWGAVLPLEALASRTALAAALGRAFGPDGVRAEAAAGALDAVVVTAGREALELPAGAAWALSGAAAARVYVTLPAAASGGA
jgi:hypothetical protein